MRPHMTGTGETSTAVTTMNMDLPNPSSMKPAGGHLAEAEPSSLTGTVAALQAEIHQLRADLEQARAERNRMLDVQQRLMDLLGTKAPERIVHDVRNVMNERELFKALADTGG